MVARLRVHPKGAPMSGLVGGAAGLVALILAIVWVRRRLPDATSRQLHILNWYLDRYARLLGRSHVIRYEDLVATRGAALAVAVPAAASLDEPLASRNKSDLYERQMMQRLGAALLANDGAWRKFYAPEDVETLLR